MKYALTLTLAFFLSIPALFTQIIYVKEKGTGTGTSWSDAAGNLSEVLRQAIPGDQIWVAAGQYFPTECLTCNDRQRNESFEIPNGVSVYGGFGGWEGNLSERNPRKNATILSGNIGQTDAFDNAFTVVYIRDGASVLLDGFIISDGYADGGTTGDDRIGSGAGLYIDARRGEAAPVIRQCVFMHNAANYGGAVFVNGEAGKASPVFERCDFVHNRSKNGGGAVLNYGMDGQVDVVFSGCQFVQNEAGFGGAVFNLSADNGKVSPQFSDCRFLKNKAINGGGIFTLASTPPTLPQTIFFLGNEAEEGADVYFEKGNRLPERLSRKHTGKLADNYKM
ncbi:MAG: hypothetical protein D6714_16750 [Bacteroidetes bacterium]|nr:MAG: hypothetical protein D6714_16750 [Bacteroidota bacterium]